MKLNRHAGFPQRRDEHQAILDRYGGVRHRMHHEGWRRLFGDLLFVRKQRDEFGGRIIAKQILLEPCVLSRIAITG
jgi:hypothetical protein